MVEAEGETERQRWFGAAGFGNDSSAVVVSTSPFVSFNTVYQNQLHLNQPHTSTCGGSPMLWFYNTAETALSRYLRSNGQAQFRYKEQEHLDVSGPCLNRWM